MKSGQAGKLTNRAVRNDLVHSNYDFMQNIKPEKKSFGQFIYDRKTGKFLTRTGRSWCKNFNLNETNNF